MHDNRRMAARWLAFVIWAAVSAMAAFWGLRLFAPGTPAPAHTLTVATAAAARGDLTRILGVDSMPMPASTSREAAPAEDRRYQLLGVAAPRAAADSREAVALIAVDGKPARAYRIGATVDGDTVVLTVGARNVGLGPRGGVATVALELPALPPPATGTPGGATGITLPAGLPGGVGARPVTPVAAPMPAPAATMSEPQMVDRPGDRPVPAPATRQ
jgi:general secretion pathway protein C